MPIDRTDLAEVLGNLLDNATRHAKTRVRITARSQSGAPLIAVEDDGPGIPSDAWSSVLRRGVRVDECAEVSPEPSRASPADPDLEQASHGSD